MAHNIECSCCGERFLGEIDDTDTCGACSSLLEGVTTKLGRKDLIDTIINLI